VIKYVSFLSGFYRKSFRGLGSAISSFPITFCNAHAERPADTLNLGLSDEIWEMVQMCFARRSREGGPEISEVLEVLGNAPFVTKWKINNPMQSLTSTTSE